MAAKASARAVPAHPRAPDTPSRSMLRRRRGRIELAVAARTMAAGTIHLGRVRGI